MTSPASVSSVPLCWILFFSPQFEIFWRVLLQENVPLAPLTTLGVGGPARFFVEAASFQDVRRAVHHAAERRLSLFVLGGGSNLVISDSGWPGMVLRVLLTGVEEREQAGKVIL